MYLTFFKDTYEKAAAIFKELELQQIEQVLFLAITLFPLPLLTERSSKKSLSAFWIGDNNSYYFSGGGEIT